MIKILPHRLPHPFGTVVYNIYIRLLYLSGQLHKLEWKGLGGKLYTNITALWRVVLLSLRSRHIYSSQLDISPVATVSLKSRVSVPVLADFKLQLIRWTDYLNDMEDVN